MHELVTQYKAYRIKCTSLAQYVLQGEIPAGGDVALREAARPRVATSVPQQTVVAETRCVVLAELPQQSDILQTTITFKSISRLQRSERESANCLEKKSE